jgi:hypothetical protein
MAEYWPPIYSKRLVPKSKILVERQNRKMNKLRLLQSVLVLTLTYLSVTLLYKH